MGIPPIPAYPLPGASELPDNVAGWQPDPHRAVLLVHDMQRYFLRPFSASSARPAGRHSRAPAGALRRAQRPGLLHRAARWHDEEQRGLLKDFWGPGMTRGPRRP